MILKIVLNKAYRLVIDNEHRKYRLSAKDDGNVYFVIRRRRPGTAGICSLIYTAMGGFAYSDENRYIPYVDLLNDKSIYTQNGQNGWDIFFEQVNGNQEINDRLIKSAKNVIVGGHYSDYRLPSAKVMFSKNELEYWHNIYKTYFKFSNKMKSRINTKYRSKVNKNDRVLGVLCRGTDYLAMKPSNHTIQPDPIEVLNRSRNAFLKYDCNKIWLATEDVNIFKMFKDVFGDSLLAVSEDFVNYNYRWGGDLANYIGEQMV